MGGEGPAIRFVRGGAITWAARTNVQYLDESERFAAYDRAKSFLLSKRDELLALEGWSEDKVPEGMMNVDIWESNFRDSGIMTGKRPYRHSTDLFIEGPLPEEFRRYLPRAEWIEEHEVILLDILGDSRHLSQLKDAAANNKISFETELITSYRNYDYDSEPMQDYTACGLECGYCGHCDY
ncbi:hypothetical protein BDQ12DRAFT_668939 [Crucibulum laeve]|uniref:Uncharacterized protein n=1 Tax=Crucibulum laeve TaxID=68775 RepID=A0A5C3LS91_9AGAR|nr:hypothetical protein BDQ12DRAFT_668939 [Crucibulum laeve]